MNSRLALVTGPTAGIGFAIAEKLVQKNIAVIINGRTPERVTTASEQLIAGGARPGQLHGVAADVSTIAGAQTIVQTFPEVDVLVNNFGIFDPKEFSEITDDDWQSMWNDNVMSGVRLSRHYFPQMLKANYGRVIFISSESAQQIPADVIHYGVSKTAQLAVARGMGRAYREDQRHREFRLGRADQIRGHGNIIKQAAANSQSTEADFEKLFFEVVRPTSLLKHFIRPEEIG